MPLKWSSLLWVALMTESDWLLSNVPVILSRLSTFISASTSVSSSKPPRLPSKAMTKKSVFPLWKSGVPLLLNTTKEKKRMLRLTESITKSSKTPITSCSSANLSFKVSSRTSWRTTVKMMKLNLVFKMLLKKLSVLLSNVLVMPSLTPSLPLFPTPSITKTGPTDKVQSLPLVL